VSGGGAIVGHRGSERRRGDRRRPAAAAATASGTAGAQADGGDAVGHLRLEFHDEGQRHRVRRAVQLHLGARRARHRQAGDLQGAEIVVDAGDHAGPLIGRARQQPRREVLLRHGFELLRRAARERLHVGVGVAADLRRLGRRGGRERDESEDEDGCDAHAPR
jgi:hypothetical protein